MLVRAADLLHRFALLFAAQAALALAPAAWLLAPYDAAARASARSVRTLAVPVTFEENAGQGPAEARFLARGDGFSLSLAEDGARIALGSGADAAIVTLRFDGAESEPAIEGLEIAPSVSRYYRGNDPARWIERVHHYERVRYRGVYPGIDVVFHARGRVLEYDFEIAPHADPSPIAIRIEGADEVGLDDDGNVALEVRGRELLLRAPQSYQRSGSAVRAVGSAYRLEADVVRFDVAAYDRARPLVVDPVLTYVTYLGGTLGERIADVAVDDGRNLYVTGYTFSSDFPASPGEAKGGASDIFVARLNAAGNALVFSTFIGGSGGDSDGRIAVDRDHNVYVSGVTGSSDFPVLGAAQPSIAGSLDFTVTKLDASGALVYSTYLGGSSLELFADGMAVDADGAAYIVGQTVSADYPTTNAAWDETCGTNGSCGGGFDGVVTKLAPDGASLVYSTYVGGSNNDFTIDVDVDAGGSAYVVGMTKSTDLPTTAGAAQPVYAGDSGDTAFDGGDAYLIKLTPAGDTAEYATYVGGSDDDGAFGVAVDASGSAYVVGATTSTDFPVSAGAYQTTFAGGVGGGSFGIPGHFVGGDGFVAKLFPDGGGYEFATYVGGSANDKLNRIALRGTSPYVSGEVRSADLPTLGGVQAGYGGGDFDAYALRLSSTGSELLAATYIGGSDDLLATAIEFAAGIAVDRDGDAYVGGGTSATDLPTTPSALQTAFGGAGSGLGDGWVAKVAMASNPPGTPPDHYLCYKAKGRPRLEPVFLFAADAFETVNVAVKKRAALCRPADRDGQGVVLRDIHALGYRMRHAPNAPKHDRQTELEVTDQFGTYLYDTKKPTDLMVPSSLSASAPPPPLDDAAHPVDALKCYRVKPSRGAPRLPEGAAVVLRDDFDEAASFAVQKPSRLCVPVALDGAPAKNAAGHLMCYAVKRSSGQHLRRSGLWVNNPLEAANPGGTGELQTIREAEVCVPALVGPQSAPVCGDDVVNQPSEQCDGLDDLACPGVLCGSDCTCAQAGVCGNGVAEGPTEACDGADDDACPGACTSLCACLGARTFTLDPSTSEAQTSLGVNVPLSGSVDLVFTEEIEPGVLVFDIPVGALPGVDLGALIGTICPFLDQDPDLPPGIAGRGVLDCAGADLAGSGFFESPDLTLFQDHCVEGAAAGFCDSAPNPGGGIVHAASGVFVPDGAEDAACSAPNSIDGSAAHGGGCNGAALLGIGATPYAPGDATLTLNVILDRRASGAGCAPPPTTGSAPVRISFTTGDKQGGVMDHNATAGAVFAYHLAGAPFSCTDFLAGSDASGASIVGVFTALDNPVLPGVELDIISSIRFSGQAP